MPKPINETVGHCLCRRCREAVADIRRFKNHERGARYLVCPDCGVDRVNGVAAQAKIDAWIDSNGAGVDSEPGPEVVPDTGPDIHEPGPDTENAGGVVPARPGPGFFSVANQQLNELFGG